MTSRRWSLLLVGEAHGLAGRRGSLWLGHPDYYERVEVIETGDYERLSAENEALKAANLDGVAWVNSARTEIEEMKAELAEARRVREETLAEAAECRKDAARYQWLRSINCPWPGVFQHEGNDDYGWSAIAGQDLDAAIDAALREGGEQMEFECAPRWRDVADELPREAQEVLFARGEKTVFGAWIGGIFWHNNQKMAAAYWMPLPKAPCRGGSK